MGSIYVTITLGDSWDRFTLIMLWVTHEIEFHQHV